MECKQEILIVAEKTGFLSRAIAEQLEKYGYEVTLTELDMQKLFEVQESVEAVLLYVVVGCVLRSGGFHAGFHDKADDKRDHNSHCKRYA